MTATVPARPKIYHILHVDRLESVVSNGCLWSDAEVQRRNPSGTTIGMSGIKQRRLTIPLDSYPDLRVGDCVPFYFCARSVMLYVLSRANHPELAYRGGQDPIVHLEADFHEAVDWLEGNGRRWAFTLSNAGSWYFADRCDLAHLDEIDWAAVDATNWQDCRDEKQAEFLVEHSFPWTLFRRVGVRSKGFRQRVRRAIGNDAHQPEVEIKPNWYY